jgi:hypothetical protein
MDNCETMDARFWRSSLAALAMRSRMVGSKAPPAGTVGSGPSELLESSFSVSSVGDGIASSPLFLLPPLAPPNSHEKDMRVVDAVAREFQRY